MENPHFIDPSGLIAEIQPQTIHLVSHGGHRCGCDDTTRRHVLGARVAQKKRRRWERNKSWTQNDVKLCKMLLLKHFEGEVFI
jgi:hypothetical protein